MWKGNSARHGKPQAIAIRQLPAPGARATPARGRPLPGNEGVFRHAPPDPPRGVSRHGPCFPAAPRGGHGGEAWAAIAKYVLMAWIAAEELGVTRANAEAMRASTDPGIRRLLGVEPGLGKALGLDEDWAFRAIRAAGNYGESFDRNLGKGSPIGLDRGLNALWTKGGLMYALPLR